MSRIALLGFLLLMLAACTPSAAMRTPTLAPTSPTSGIAVTITFTPSPVKPQSSEEALLPSETSTPAAAETPAEKPTISSVSTIVLRTETVREENVDPTYTINVRYPLISSTESLSNADLLNMAIQSFITDTVTNFRTDARDFAAEATVDPNTPTSGSSLDVDAETPLVRPDLVSIQFSLSVYMAGAAHPNAYSHAMNFDPVQGRQLELDDLFTEGAIEQIAAYCEKELRAHGTLMFEEGAKPTADNYRNWVLTPDGMRITFDPYQVAPYAAGSQIVLIPYNTLQPLMRPDSPLAAMLR